LAAVCALCACFRAPVFQDSKEAPAWVAKGSGAFDEAGGKAFYGVGAAEGIVSGASLRTVADDRARLELVHLLKGIGAQSSAADAVIIDHWVNSKDGTTYALCRLSLDTAR
jgi:hypothetical protein